MKNIASISTITSKEELAYKEQFLAQFNQYLYRQPAIIRGLHLVLRVLSLICLVLPIAFFFPALYHTYLWATTGSFTSLGAGVLLPEAWANFGLSCSFIVFPWGLDAMLLRAFPTVVFASWRKPRKPINFITGTGAFFAGLGIMCAGAPGAARMIDLASRAIQNLF